MAKNRKKIKERNFRTNLTRASNGSNRHEKMTSRVDWILAVQKVLIKNGMVFLAAFCI